MSETSKLHIGPIHSVVSGRTDHLPMEVPSGSYVIPADIVSAYGEGNTMAGFKVIRRLFGANTGRGGSAQNPDMPSVPIVAAGGEYVLSPQEVISLGEGDIDLGHKVLDEFVKRSRAELVKTLNKLPGPRKS